MRKKVLTAFLAAAVDHREKQPTQAPHSKHNQIPTGTPIPSELFWPGSEGGTAGAPTCIEFLFLCFFFSLVGYLPTQAFFFWNFFGRVDSRSITAGVRCTHVL